MDNPIDEKSADTSQASPADQKTPEGTENENVVASEPTQQQQPTEEEAAWNSLKGNTQQRIQEILRENKSLEAKLSNQPVQNQVAQPTYSTQASDDEVMQAANILKTKANFVTKDQLDALAWTLDKEKKHERYAAKYSGTDGLPKYDREEVEDYMNRKQIWDPEVAFRDMWFDEFVDAGKTQRKQAYTEKPTASAGRDEPLTLESFKEKLRKDPGYYDKLKKNPDQFDSLLSQLIQE